MAFDLLSWMLSFGLGKAAGAVIDQIQSKDLSAKLAKAARTWQQGLPETFADFHVEALFPRDPELSEERPALEALQRRMAQRQVPPAELFLEALLEQWHAVRKDPHTQSFFQISQEEARLHLGTLAEALWRESKADTQFFQSTAIDSLAEILQRLDEAEMRKVPIASALYEKLKFWELHAQKKNVPFVTPHILVALLDDVAVGKCFEAIRRGVAQELRTKLKRYVDTDLPESGRSYAAVDWEAGDGVRRARAHALQDRARAVTSLYLLLGTLESSESKTVADIRGMLDKDFDRLLEAVRNAIKQNAPSAMGTPLGRGGKILR